MKKDGSTPKFNLTYKFDRDAMIYATYSKGYRPGGVNRRTQSPPDPPLSTYIVYSPSDKADFFCFEPVTHPVDAHNLPGGPEANGLSILAPQEAVSATCRFRPRRLIGTAVPA